MTNVLDFTPPLNIPVFLAVQPATMAGLPEGYGLWRFALKRSDGNWRIGALKAKSRETASLMLQGATGGRTRLMFKTTVAKVETASRRGEV